jgi:acetyltransferase-like isoleucine patch superfamily enzyme
VSRWGAWAATLDRRRQSLRSTRRTSHWEIDARRPPALAAYRALGPGAVVVPPASIPRPDLLSIGARVLLHEGTSILIAEGARGVDIGEGTVLSRYSHIACAHRVTIGRHVSSSDHVAVLDTWNPIPGQGDQPPPGGAVVIEDGAYLGFGAIVGPGVTVGAGAFVGEGAVVLDDVPAHTVVYGNPARLVRQLTPAGWGGARFP